MYGVKHSFKQCEGTTFYVKPFKNEDVYDIHMKLKVSRALSVHLSKNGNFGAKHFISLVKIVFSC